MVLLCFVLDLRSLPPPILENLKQSLTRLGNYYALSPSSHNHSGRSTALPDLIGVYYISSRQDEPEIAYSPEGEFNLRTFHHALKTLPTDFFSHRFNAFGSLYCNELKLQGILDHVIILSSRCPDITARRKVILISSCDVKTTDDEIREALKVKTSKNVSLEFVFLERKSSHYGDVTANINHPVEQIGDLGNWKLLAFTPDLHVLTGHVKRWFQELNAKKENLLQAHFIFRINIPCSMNQLSCNLYTFYYPITDGFTFCQGSVVVLSIKDNDSHGKGPQEDRCHGISLDQSHSMSRRSSCCPITNNELDYLDIWDNAIKLGEQTTLYLPSFHEGKKLQKVSSPVKFDVIQRTNLGSLSEGVIIGTTYVVAPTTFPHTDDIERSKLNNQVFQAVCSVLNSLDQGLVCSSMCNLETLMETSFKCYYILLPSDKGLMVLRRLLASEEFFPIPDDSKLIYTDGYKEIENTVRESLLKIEMNNYDPVQHERRFHEELNLLVNRSLRLYTGKIKRPESREDTLKWDDNLLDTPSVGVDRHVTGDETHQSDLEAGKEKIVKEREQLVIEVADSDAATRPSNSKKEPMDDSPSQNGKKLNEKTSSILERLEIPSEIKRKAVSLTTSSSAVVDASPHAKRPLIPFESCNAAAQGPEASKPVKLKFKNLKNDKSTKE